MSNYLATDSDLTSVADAIRAKGGTQAQLAFPSGFVSAIGDISGGGGGNVNVSQDANGYLVVDDDAPSGGGGGEPPLPSGYTRLAYLQSNGTQYIDTGLEFDNDWDIAMCAQATVPQTAQFQNAWGINGTFFQFSNYAASSVYWGGVNYCGTNASGAVTSYALDNDAYVCKNGRYNVIPTVGEVVTFSGTGGTAGSLTLAIFARHNAATAYDYPFSGKLYNFKIRKSGQVVHWFVPAMRNSDSVLGLYDLVGNAFHVNSGTGTFTGGALNV